MNWQRWKEVFAPLVSNRIVMIILGVFLWMLIFDSDSFISYHHNSRKISSLMKERAELIEKIEHSKRKMSELRGSKDRLEKFAREEYFMKRDDEVIFIIK